MKQMVDVYEGCGQQEVDCSRPSAPADCCYAGRQAQTYQIFQCVKRSQKLYFNIKIFYFSKGGQPKPLSDKMAPLSPFAASCSRTPMSLGKPSVPPVLTTNLCLLPLR